MPLTGFPAKLAWATEAAARAARRGLRARGQGLPAPPAHRAVRHRPLQRPVRGRVGRARVRGGRLGPRPPACGRALRRARRGAAAGHRRRARAAGRPPGRFRAERRCSGDARSRCTPRGGRGRQPRDERRPPAADRVAAGARALPRAGPLPLPGQPTCIGGGFVLAGGSALAWFAALAAGSDDVRDRRPPRRGGGGGAGKRRHVFLPDLVGRGSLRPDPAAAATFAGLRLRHGRPEPPGRCSRASPSGQRRRGGACRGRAGTGPAARDRRWSGERAWQDLRRRAAAARRARRGRCQPRLGDARGRVGLAAASTPPPRRWRSDRRRRRWLRGRLRRRLRATSPPARGRRSKYRAAEVRSWRFGKLYDAWRHARVARP